MLLRSLLAPSSSPLGAALAGAMGAHLHPYNEAPSLTHHPWVAVLLPARGTPDAGQALHEATAALRLLARTPGIVLSNTDVFDEEATGLRRESFDPDAQDAFGLALVEAEAAAHGKPVLRIPTPLFACPEAAPLAFLGQDGPLPDGALQAAPLAEIAAAALRDDLPSLLHLSSGPVPVEALAPFLARAIGPEKGHGPGWDRLRSDWSELWGRPDGLLSARRAHIEGLLAFARALAP